MRVRADHICGCDCLRDSCLGGPAAESEGTRQVRCGLTGPAEDRGLGERGARALGGPRASPVTCPFGAVAGEWQAGERNTTQRELWGLGEQESWRFFPRLLSDKEENEMER